MTRHPSVYRVCYSMNMRKKKIIKKDGGILGISGCLAGGVIGGAVGAVKGIFGSVFN